MSNSIAHDIIKSIMAAKNDIIKKMQSTDEREYPKKVIKMIYDNGITYKNIYSLEDVYIRIHDIIGSIQNPDSISISDVLFLFGDVDEIEIHGLPMAIYKMHYNIVTKEERYSLIKHICNFSYITNKTRNSSTIHFAFPYNFYLSKKNMFNEDYTEYYSEQDLISKKYLSSENL